MEPVIVHSSVSNRLFLLKKKLEAQFPHHKIMPYVLQAWAALTNGKNPEVEMTRQFNPLKDTIPNILKGIDDNDAVAITAWGLFSAKVTNSKFAAAVMYQYANSVYNATPSSVNTENENMMGLHNYSNLALDVSGDTILSGIPSAWFLRIPPVVNSAGGGDATPENQNFETMYKPIYEDLLFEGGVRNTWKIQLGGDNNTIAGDSTASPAEQNYVIVGGIGFRVQDGGDDAKKLIKTQGPTCLAVNGF